MTTKKNGEHLTARDVKEQLIQDVPAMKLLLWPPNLFAFTSYMLSLSGAYQLVVSPPKLYNWPPTYDQLIDFLNKNHWTEFEKTFSLKDKDSPSPCSSLKEEIRNITDFIKTKSNEEKPWTYWVRKCGLTWRQNLEELDKRRVEEFIEHSKDISLLDEKTSIWLTHNIPPFLLYCWATFERLYFQEDVSVSELLCNDKEDCEDKWHASLSLLSMHAIADEACIGWGIQDERKLVVNFLSVDGESSLTLERKAAQKEADRLLKSTGTLATLNTSRGRVLPKRHNPDVGITLRSLSSNLAFHRSSIEVFWSVSGENKDNPLARRLQLESEKSQLKSEHSEKRFTILLLPYPLSIETKDFKKFRPDDLSADNPDSRKPNVDNLPSYYYFEYGTAKTDKTDLIQQTLQKAQKEMGTVDMVILPELALNRDGVRALEKILPVRNDNGDIVSYYITGVRDTDKTKGFPNTNAVYYKSAVKDGPEWRFQSEEELKYKTKFRQFKHHRWQLNQSQIQQYGLSQELARDKKWWEAIHVGRRRVSFINIGEQITICPLICEDLARQDPIADLIRHVGPSLVVTILMDGPQRTDRWSARYAGILSEDPGSAVITLTSFGMVRRWNAPYRPLSRIVALWNDKNGPREIEIEQGASGILLSLSVHAEREPIADGRLEIYPTSKISLIDVIQIHLD